MFLFYFWSLRNYFLLTLPKIVATGFTSNQTSMINAKFKSYFFYSTDALIFSTKRTESLIEAAATFQNNVCTKLKQKLFSEIKINFKIPKYYQVPFYPAYSLFPSFRLLKLPTWRIPDRRCFRTSERERERIESKSSN